MDERLQFVARRLAGEPMAELCREFGISRKTGYEIFDRYQDCGIQGLTDRSRRPYRYANQLPFQVENFVLNVKREHPSWGARKIRERLTRERSSWIHFCSQPGAGSLSPCCYDARHVYFARSAGDYVLHLLWHFKSQRRVLLQ